MWYKLDDWEEEPVSDSDEFDRCDIYRERIAASAAPTRNDSVNERLRCRGPPGGWGRVWKRRWD